MSYGKNFPIVKKLTFFFHRDEKKNEILEDIFSKGIKKKHKNGEGIRYRMKERYFDEKSRFTATLWLHRWRL